MTFIIVLIALLVERFFDWSHFRNWSWCVRIEQWVLARFPHQSPYAILSMLIAPLLVGVFLVEILMGNILYGFLWLIFEIVVLLYCLGPQNLWADIYAGLEAFNHPEMMEVAEKLKSNFAINGQSKSVNSLHKKFVNKIFIESNTRIFAPVFWFIILGAVGAVLYRVIKLFSLRYATKSDNQLLARTAYTIEAILDWLPARIFTFFFALGGHFVQVFACWRKYLTLPPSSNDALLMECGAAALDGSTNAENSPGIEKLAVSLIDRSLIIFLVALGILSIFSF